MLARCTFSSTVTSNRLMNCINFVTDHTLLQRGISNYERFTFLIRKFKCAWCSLFTSITPVKILHWEPLKSSSHIFLFPLFLFKLPSFSLTFSPLLHSSLTLSVSLSQASCGCSCCLLIIPTRWRQQTKIHPIALTSSLSGFFPSFLLSIA